MERYTNPDKTTIVAVIGDIEGIGIGQRPWDAVSNVTYEENNDTFTSVGWDNPNEDKWSATKGNWETLRYTDDNKTEIVLKGRWYKLPNDYIEKTPKPTVSIDNEATKLVREAGRPEFGDIMDKVTVVVAR